MGVYILLCLVGISALNLGNGVSGIVLAERMGGGVESGGSGDGQQPMEGTAASTSRKI